jgi:hypothetical protein
VVRDGKAVIRGPRHDEAAASPAVVLGVPHGLQRSHFLIKARATRPPIEWATRWTGSLSPNHSWSLSAS